MKKFFLCPLVFLLFPTLAAYAKRCLITTQTAAGITYANDYRSLSEAISAAQSSSRPLILPCGTYTLAGTQTITATGFTMRGEAGQCVNIHFSNATDLFLIQASNVSFQDLQFTYIGTASRGGSAIFNFSSRSAQQGYARNIRLIGSSSAPNNGDIFYSNNPGGGGLWHINLVRVPGTLTWNSMFKVVSNGATNTSYVLEDLDSGFVTWKDAALVFDGSIDTVYISNSNITSLSGTSGPIIWLRNTVSSADPRIIHCTTCTVENRGGTAIKLDASRDFQFIGGNISTARVGVGVGANAVDTRIQGTQFINIEQQAITIANGSVNTLIQGNTFDDTGKQSNNTYATVQVSAGASDWDVSLNTWRMAPGIKNLPAWGINVASGTTDRRRVIGNNAPEAAFGTSFYSDQGSGASLQFFGNTPNISGEQFSSAVKFVQNPSMPCAVLLGATSGSMSVCPPSTAGGTANLVPGTEAVLGTTQTWIAAQTFKQINAANLLISDMAPTISSGFGTAPSITVNNGTLAFRINVGTGGTATSGVIGLPAAVNGWDCDCEDRTTFSTTVFKCRQTADTTTNVTIGNFNSSAAPAAWVDSNILAVTCRAR